MSICYTGSNMLVCALSFDSQLSCVFFLIECIPIFSNVFPFSSFADSIINFPSLLDTMLGNKPIYGLDSHLSNQPALQPQEAAT